MQFSNLELHTSNVGTHKNKRLSKVSPTLLFLGYLNLEKKPL